MGYQPGDWGYDEEAHPPPPPPPAATPAPAPAPDAPAATTTSAPAAPDAGPDAPAAPDAQGNHGRHHGWGHPGFLAKLFQGIGGAIHGAADGFKNGMGHDQRGGQPAAPGAQGVAIGEPNGSGGNGSPQRQGMFSPGWAQQFAAGWGQRDQAQRPRW